MTSVDRVLVFIAAGLGLLLALWLGIAFLADEHSYIKLARAGLLLIGLGGIACGFLWRRPWVPLMGLAFLAVGFLTCLIGPGSLGESGGLGGQWTSHFADRLAHPLDRSGNLRAWHFLGIVFLGLNSVLLVRHADWRRFVAANLLAVAGSLVILLVLARN